MTIARRRRSTSGAASVRREAMGDGDVTLMAMIGGLDYTAVRDAIITHPTVAEGLNLLFTPAWMED